MISKIKIFFHMNHIYTVVMIHVFQMLQNIYLNHALLLKSKENQIKLAYNLTYLFKLK